jgi:molybdenum cofactor cytidylyltransferase
LENPCGRVSAVILAAGLARRMGRDKLNLPLGDRPVIRHVAETVSSIEWLETIAVINPRNGDAICQALDGLPLRFVLNDRFEEGIATSIAAGAAAVASRSAAMMLVQGDQPLVTAAMLGEMVDAWSSDGSEFVAASFGKITTTPFLFDSSLLGELSALGGDVGARAVLRRHKGRMIDFPPWRGLDLDTDEDYANVCRIWKTLGPQ